MQTETASRFKPFESFAIPGDTREIEYGPFTIRATLHHDGDTRPDDFECHSPEIIAAWRRDEWRYVGVVLSIHLNAATLDGHAASLWGVECNFPGGDGNAYLSEIAEDLLFEAIERADIIRAELIQKLAI